MGQHVSRSDFIWSYTEQPHAGRRRSITGQYPEIKRLYGLDPSFKWVVSVMVLTQILAAYLLRDSDWLLIVLQAYLSGGVINHALTLAIHDIAHNCAYGNGRPMANRLFGIWVNLPIGLPMSISFKKYHVEHHRYLGENALDTDIPTDLEARLFSTGPRKLFWLVMQPFFYAFRPLIVYRKTPTDMEILNALVQLAFDLIVYRFFGFKALFYLIFGTVIAMGLHPSAGHFVSEHYVFTNINNNNNNKYNNQKYENRSLLLNSENDDTDTVVLNEDNTNKNTADQLNVNGLGGNDGQRLQETYSYYGPWNLVTFNVGYHMEHHDFPNIPGRSLPLVRKIAPSYYNGLQSHQSWTKVLYDFVVQPDVGPYARIKRPATIQQTLLGNNMLEPYFDAALHYVGYYQMRYFLTSLVANFKKTGHIPFRESTELYNYDKKSD